MDEHQDDLEPEVEEGAEFETQTYAPEPFEDDVTDEPEQEGQGDRTDEPANTSINSRQRIAARQVHLHAIVTIGTRN